MQSADMHEDGPLIALSSQGSPLQGYRQGQLSKILRAFSEAQVQAGHLSENQVTKLRHQKAQSGSSGICATLVLLTAKSITKQAESTDLNENYYYNAIQALLKLTPNIANVIGQHSQLQWQKNFEFGIETGLGLLAGELSSQELDQLNTLGEKAILDIHNYFSELTRFIEKYYTQSKDIGNFEKRTFKLLNEFQRTELDFFLSGSAVVTGTSKNLAAVLETLPTDHFCYVGCNNHAILVWRDNNSHFYVDNPNRPEKQNPMTSQEASMLLHDGFSIRHSPDNAIAKLNVFSNYALGEKKGWQYDTKVLWDNDYQDRLSPHNAALSLNAIQAAAEIQDTASLRYHFSHCQKNSLDITALGKITDLIDFRYAPTVIVEFLRAKNSQGEYVFQIPEALLDYALEHHSKELMIELLSGERKNEITPPANLNKTLKTIRNTALETLDENALTFSFSVMKAIATNEEYEKFVIGALVAIKTSNNLNALSMLKVLIQDDIVTFNLPDKKNEFLALISEGQKALEEKEMQMLDEKKPERLAVSAKVLSRGSMFAPVQSRPETPDAASENKRGPSPKDRRGG